MAILPQGKFFKIPSRDLIYCGIILAVLAVSSYSLFLHLGIYGDDWGASTYLYASNLHSAVTMWWHAGSGEIQNFRLLAVVIPVLWYYAFKVFGLAGIILINFLCYFAIAVLFYLILKKHTAPAIAAIAALMFAIYPTNNAYLWQVTISYGLSMLFILSAVLLFNNKKFWLTALFLSISLLINEAVFFVFILALLPEGLVKVSWPELKLRVWRWTAVCFSPLIIYAIFRLVLELKGITGGNRAVSSLQHFHLVSYVLQFATAAAVNLIIAWAVAVWKILHYGKIIDIVVGLTAFLGAYVIAKPLYVDAEGEKTKSLYLLIAGIVLIFAGRYYGFYFVPSINTLNLDSRYYFASSVGGAVFFAGLFQLLLVKLQGKKRWLPIFVVCLMVALSAVSRFSVQRDYALSWSGAQRFWQTFFVQVPALSGQPVIIVNVPPRKVDQPVGWSEAMGDLRHLVPLFYGSNTLGMVDLAIEKISSSGQNTCFTSTPFYVDNCVENSRVVHFAWDGWNLVKTSGSFVVSTQAQAYTVSDPIKKILNIK